MMKHAPEWVEIFQSGGLARSIHKWGSQEPNRGGFVYASLIEYKYTWNLNNFDPPKLVWLRLMSY